MSQRILFPWVTALALVLSACGGGGGSGGDTQPPPSNPDPRPPSVPDPQPTALSGVFVDSPVAGLGYSTPTRSGTTDANGTFRYLAGEMVTFSIGPLVIGSVAGADQITPFTLFGLTPPTNQDEIDSLLSDGNVGDFDRMANIVALLVALDADDNPENGIDLSGRDLTSASLDFNQDHTTFRNGSFQTFLSDQSIEGTAWQSSLDHLYGSLNISVNHSPVFTSGTSGTALENSTSASYTATATDEDGDTLTYSISGGADQDKFSINASSGALSFKAAPDFENPGDGNTDNIYAIQIQVSDGAGGSDSLTVVLEVTNLNETPIFISENSAAILENQTYAGLTASGIDPDGDNLRFSIVDGEDSSNFSIDDVTGVLSFVSAPDYETPSDADADNIYVLIIEINDGKGAFNQQSASISVTNQNDNAPVFTSSISHKVDENLAETNYVATATDADGDSPTFGIAGGADQALFSITNDGAIRFHTPANYEVPTDTNADNLYELTIEASDGLNNSQLNLSLIVEDADDPFVFLSASTVSTPENITSTGYVASALDEDVDSVSLSLTAGNDQALFDFDTGTGELTFKSAPDFESPLDHDANNDYEITIQADDNLGNAIQQEVTIVVTDETSLSFEVSYPTPNANLGGYATQTSVTGYVIDDEDGEVLDTDISYLDVNSTFATFNIDEPQRWSAQVPASSDNLLELSLLDASGNLSALQQNIFNGVPLTTPKGIVLDVINNKALILNQPTGLHTVVEIDLDTGASTIVSGGDVGSGKAFGFTQDVALDVTNDRILVLSGSWGGTLFAVDPDDGARNILSDRDVGSGPRILNPVAMVIDTTNNRAITTDLSNGILSVDLDTGNRTVLSGSAAGTGPEFDAPGNITADYDNNRVLVTDNTLKAIFAVDINTGDRTIISDSTTGSGDAFSLVRDLAIDSVRHRLLVIDDLVVLAVDPSNGNRSIVSNYIQGEGQAFGSPKSIEFDAINDRALVLDYDSVLEIAPATGDRTIFSKSSSAGNGEAFMFIIDVAFDKANNRLLALDQSQGLISVDLSSGDRALISGSSVGSGPNFVSPSRLALDKANNQALVLDPISSNDTIFKVDLATGNRTILSDDSTGTGMEFVLLSDIVVDSPNSRVVATDFSLRAVFDVDLSTGNRTIISDETVGTGPALRISALELDTSSNRLLATADNVLYSIALDTGDRVSLGYCPCSVDLESPTGLSLDEENNRVLVADAGKEAVVAISLATGDRVVISGSSSSGEVGSGPNFSTGPSGIAFDNTNKRVFTAEPELRAMIVMEVNSGERSIGSQ